MYLFSIPEVTYLASNIPSLSWRDQWRVIGMRWGYEYTESRELSLIHWYIHSFIYLSIHPSIHSIKVLLVTFYKSSNVCWTYTDDRQRLCWWEVQSFSPSLCFKFSSIDEIFGYFEGHRFPMTAIHISMNHPPPKNKQTYQFCMLVQKTHRHTEAHSQIRG